MSNAKKWYIYVCYCVSGVNDLRLSHEQKAHNGDIDQLKLESMPLYRRRNWWLNAHTTIQKDLFVNSDGRYECPREYCGKTYKEASSLQRHIRCVFSRTKQKQTIKTNNHVELYSIHLPHSQLPMENEYVIRSKHCNV